MPREITASYDVVTPMMLGGANHAPEFRLASYVHVVRWWWRFLALGRFGDARTASFWEAVLFGWHAPPFGRKRVSFRLTGFDGNHVQPWNGNLALGQWSGISYLTAQGFSEREPAPVSSFSVEARIGRFECDQFKNALKKAKILKNENGFQPYDQVTGTNWSLALETLKDAMALIGLLGGLGARSRRGFGSLAILKLDVDGEPIIKELPNEIPEYEQQIKDHLGGNPFNGEPPYTAYSDGFSPDICASENDTQKLMNDIGWAFQIYRSWGHSGRPHACTLPDPHIHSLKSDGNESWIPGGDAKTWYDPAFKADHEKFYANKPDGPKFGGNHFDNRAVFGLPHNYGSTQVGWDTPNGQPIHGRRASPLLFHFHRLKSDKVVFVACVAPARFAPRGAQIRVQNNLRQIYFARPVWRDLEGFAGFVRTRAPAVIAAADRGIRTTYTPETVIIK